MLLLESLFGILATWVVVYAALVGAGARTMRWLGAALHDDRDVASAFWIGFTVVLGVLQLWQLVLPVTGATTAIVIGGGWLLLIAERRTVHLAMAGAGGRHLWLLVGLGILWIATRALGGVTLYDSGMYHVPFVNWAKSFAIVPGLGNLHGRLAFNSATLLVAAMLDVGPWTDGASHLVNGLLISAFALHALVGARRLFGAAPPHPSDAFELAALPGVLAAVLRQDVRSLSTDLPVFVLLLMVSSRLFTFLEKSDGDAAGERGEIAVLFALIAAAICAKLSAAPFAAAATATVFIVVLLRRRSTRRRPISGRAMVLPILLVIPWLARGVILSGYPLYPSRIAPFPVDWRVPAEQADAESAWITMSARNLNSNALVTSRDWLGEWIRDVATRGDLFSHIVAPVAVLLFALLIWMLQRRRGWRRSGRGTGSWLFAPIVVATIVWWTTAPHTRLAQGLFWGAVGCAVALLMDGPVAGMQHRARQLVVGVGALTLTFAARIAIGEASRAGQGNGGRVVLDALLATPVAGRWLVPMPEPRLLSYVTPGGVDIAVPKQDNSCWNGPLVCTPHPVPGLRLRRPGEIASGFRIDGAWAPMWFPNPWIAFLPYWRCLREGPPPAASLEEACRSEAARDPRVSRLVP